MRRVRIAVVYLICEDIVLILICCPVIEAEFGTEGRFETVRLFCPVQIGGISLLREGVVGIHLLQDIQIIVLAVNGRVAQFLVIVPADDIAAVGTPDAEADVVVSDPGREKIKSFSVVNQLLIDAIGLPGRSDQKIRNIFRKIRLDIQCHPVFQNGGEIIIGGNNIRQIAAGQRFRIGIRRQMNIPDIDVQQILEIFPQFEPVFPVDAL